MPERWTTAPRRRLRGITVVAWLGLHAQAWALAPLPEGPTGIAAKYVADEGIGDDPEVIVFDDFESYAASSDLDAHWESVYQYQNIAFATAPEDVFAGAQSLEFTLPQGDGEVSNAVTKWISPEPDVMFLRYYTKFDGAFAITGSSHNGGMIASHYFNGHDATPGIPADGTNKWLVTLENLRESPQTASPGLLNVYIYHPEQRDDYGDHFFPTGLVAPNTSLPYDFGPDFTPRPDVIQPLQTWQCMELMVVANTPGQRDGRIAAWIDGALVADWPNLRLRDVPELTIDRIWLAFHAGNNAAGETRKWYDNVVVASAYIGPIGDGSAPGDTTGAASDGGGDGSSDAGTGNDGPGASGGTAAGDDASTLGADGSTTASSAADGAETDAGAQGQDQAASGCSCASSSPNPATAWLLVAGLGFGAARRRRQRPVACGRAAGSKRAR
ncbi:MAG: VPLPA-CTERM sorting domain-containing protein [Deltaproteobacteria bacterium]|nr:VPLPA-CTERM sorting domain-containing protein [Deltaproteobacteria bacterium]MBK8713538.1 VPLPA-CTERM sorting domain-containing protein [Deltaproteobacteria bacterium]MBP7289671.1 VPLPA-CTERM sorting domain-containing protein [Nannocystaceae bacterium]